MISASQQTEQPHPLVVSAQELAKRLDVSERHVWAMNSSGRLPRPLHFGRAVRWNLQELQQWLDAGCPSRDQWEKIKAGK